MSDKEKRGFGDFRRNRHAFGVVEKPKDLKKTLKRFALYLLPKKWKVVGVTVFALISTVFTILSPRILGQATDVIFKGVMARFRRVPDAGIDFKALENILVVLVGIYVLSAVFNFLMQYMMAGIAQETVYRMRDEINRKLKKLPVSYFDTHSHGDILSRVTNDIDNIANTLQQSLAQLLTSVVSIFGVIVMMLSINPWLTLIALGILPLSALLTIFVARHSQKYFKTQQNILGKLNGHVEEMFGGHTIVQVFGHEEESVRDFKQMNRQLFETGWRAQFISGLLMPLINVLNNIGYVLVSVLGAWFVVKRWISIGSVQAFIQYSRQFGQPMVQAANITNIIQSALASSERVFEILDEPEEEESEDVFPQEIRGSLVFEGVDFSYDPKSPLIRDLSLEVQAGHTIAIVGPTGAGKTTLVNLMMRFYDVQKGRILIDTLPIRSYQRKSLRRLFGMVLQDVWLFQGTIFDNIAYGSENASLEAVMETAKKAGAHHFIMALPDGYETVLSEDSQNLSQGQKQLLTIARAMMAKPPIMILDEATSSVDTRTEMKIQQAMDRLMKGRTAFVIAHRLSTIRNAHRILVMNEGKMIEQGTHESLLNQNGFYAELYRSQFEVS